MATAVDIGTLITKRPEMHSGRPCIAGTGTTVLAIVALYEQGFGPQGIHEQFPQLSLAGILAALTYWAANPEEVEGYFREDHEAHDEWLAEVLAKR
jgi:uncharacterized protein (DUF433 family)